MKLIICVTPNGTATAKIGERGVEYIIANDVKEITRNPLAVTDELPKPTVVYTTVEWININDKRMKTKLTIIDDIITVGTPLKIETI